MAKVILYIGIISTGVICGLAAMVPDSARSYNYSKPVRNLNWVGYQTTASELYRNYSAYEAAAKITTGRLAIEISGTIKSIDHNLFDETELYMDAGGDTRGVMVTLDRPGPEKPGHEARALTAGSSVIVRCESMTRILGPPIGQGCQLVS